MSLMCLPETPQRSARVSGVKGFMSYPSGGTWMVLYPTLCPYYLDFVGGVGVAAGDGNSRIIRSSGIGCFLSICFMKNAMPLSLQ